MKIAYIIFLMMTGAAFGAERTPWKEPPLGPISPTGTVVDIENYHCTVEHPRKMVCLNVGRVCIEKRARDEARSARRFGCAIAGEKNYPCPPDDPSQLEEIKEIGSCWPMSIGGM